MGDPIEYREQRYESTTAFVYNTSIEEAESRGLPRLLVYYCTAETFLNLSHLSGPEGRRRGEEMLKQYEYLQTFIRDLGDTYHIHRCHEFKTPIDFQQSFQRDIQALMIDVLQARKAKDKGFPAVTAPQYSIDLQAVEQRYLQWLTLTLATALSKGELSVEVKARLVNLEASVPDELENLGPARLSILFRVSDYVEYIKAHPEKPIPLIHLLRTISGKAFHMSMMLSSSQYLRSALLMARPLYPWRNGCWITIRSLAAWLRYCMAVMKLLSFLRKTTRRTGEALRAAVRDVQYVRQEALQATYRFRSIDSAILPHIFQGLTDSDCMVAYATVQLLKALGRNDKAEEKDRQKILEALAIAAQDSSAQRLVEPAYTPSKIPAMPLLRDKTHDAMMEIMGLK